MSDAPPSYEAAVSGSQPYTKKEEHDPLYGPAHGYNPGSGPGYPLYPQHVGSQPPYPPQSGPYPVTSSAAGGVTSQPVVGQTVIIQQPLIGSQFHEAPVSMVCPTCQASILTTLTYESGTLAWVACAVLCLVGCDAGCCLIPFCCDSCQDVVHSCPNCNRTVGRYVRM